MKRKDMGDLKKDIADTADTADELMQCVVTKSKNVADDIKKGVQDVGQGVKQTVKKISRRVSASKRHK